MPERLITINWRPCRKQIMKMTPIYSMLLMVTIIAGCAGRVPTLGVENDRLAPCPDSPNCVNSQAQADDEHFIPPIKYTGTREAARERLLAIIQNTSRTRVLTSTEDYIRVEYTSLLLRFVDDVEFFLPEDPVIHVRSASLGVNRRRVEDIRARFSAAEED